MAPESGLVFLFDENTPPRLVRALRELGQAAFHVYDVKLKGAPDERVLSYAGERAWCVVSSDRAILKRPAERSVISELQIGTFFVNDSVRGECDLARTLFRHWPEMKRLGSKEARPFLYLVTERRISRIWKRRLGPKQG